MDVTEVSVDAWGKGGKPQFNSSPLLAIGLSNTATEAELATLKRINGTHKDIFDGEGMRQSKQSIYVVADMSFNLPAGPPNFIRSNSMEEFKRLAARTKTNVEFVSMKVVGSAEIDGRRGVVIEYTHMVWPSGVDGISRGLFCAIQDGSKLKIFEWMVTS